MNLTILGWAVVHSLWQGTFIAGLTALIVSLVPDRRARTRYVVLCASLAIMAIAPMVTAIATVDVLGFTARQQVVRAIEAPIGLPAVVRWRSVVVPAAAVVWMAGFALCLVRIGGEWKRARALRRDGLDDAGDAVRAAVADLREQLSLDAAVAVCRSTRASVPMLLGWLRPIILLPAGTVGELRAAQLRAVLAHELAHVERRDYLANLLQLAADALLFHHPGARWVSRRIRTEREYCCDDVALTIAPDPGDYARALAALEDARDDCRLAVAAASGTLLDRIQRIVGHPRRVLTPARGAVVLVIASLLASIMLAFAMVVPPSLPLDVKLRTRMPPLGVGR